MIEYIIGTFGILGFIFIVVLAVLALLMPIFIYTIRVYVVRIDRKMDLIFDLLRRGTDKEILKQLKIISALIEKH